MIPIAPSDYEALSAYLDNELSPRERSRLEQRLQGDAALQAGLADLRHTRAILRAQPRLRAPRNFVLTPQMAGVRQGRVARPMTPMFPVLRFASALATFFFILMTVGSFYLRTYASPPAIVTAMQQPDVQAHGMGGDDGGAPQAAVESPVPQAAVELAPAAPMEGEANATGVALAPPEGQPDQPPMSKIAPPAATAVEAPLLNGDPGRPLPPANGRETVSPGQSTYRLGWTILIAVQVLLALLALVTGGAALWLRYSARR